MVFDMCFDICLDISLLDIRKPSLVAKIKLYRAASLVLDGASTADITLHLHLAVGQFAAVVLMWLQHASTDDRDGRGTKG